MCVFCVCVCVHHNNDDNTTTTTNNNNNTNTHMVPHPPTHPSIQVEALPEEAWATLRSEVFGRTAGGAFTVRRLFLFFFLGGGGRVMCVCVFHML